MRGSGIVLNGQSLGRKKTNRDTAYLATGTFLIQTGVLKAIGYSEGRK
jgi:hypothetical protein